MSDLFNCRPGQEHESGYQIRNLGGCRVVEGYVPMGDLSMLCRGFSRKALLAVDLADLMGAALVIGEPEDIDRMRANRASLPISAARQRDVDLALARGLPDDLVRWLQRGERGASSNALCQSLFGVPEGKPLTGHPHDPDDLRRCLAFVAAAGIPAQDVFRIGPAPVSKAWSALKKRWEELLACYNAELAADKTKRAFPLTYALMKEILGGVDE